MFNVSEEDARIIFEMSSTPAHVDRVIAECRAFLRARAPDGRSAPAEQAMRELLLNAVEHGNGNDAARQIHCAVEHLGGLRFGILVRDQGRGFDLAAVLRAAGADPDSERSRGYAIIRACADEVTAGAEPGAVTVFITLARETDFEVEWEQRRAIVRPRGDLTAVVAERFRACLLTCLEQGAAVVCIDLAQAENVDSICLSILVAFSKTSARAGRKVGLEISGAAPDLERLLELTRISAIYHLLPGRSGT